MAYIDQTRKALIAAALKPVMPAGWKYSLAVRNHMSLVLTIQAAPVDLLAGRAERQHRTHTQINTYHLDLHFQGELLETFRKILAVLNEGNHDRSDLMTDYFDVGWYVDVNIGRWDRPFVCTAAASPAQVIVAACVARGLPADHLVVSVVR